MGFGHNSTGNERWYVSDPKSRRGWNVSEITWGWSRDISYVDGLNLLNDFIGLCDIYSILLKHFFFLFLIFNQLLLLFFKQLDLLDLRT